MEYNFDPKGNKKLLVKLPKTNMLRISRRKLLELS
jgi:hypothetical protein